MSVLGVDKFDKMLVLAKSYATPPLCQVEYKIQDMVEPVDVKGEQIQGPFNFIIACFSLQDCSNMEAAIQLCAKNIIQNGILLVVFEDLAILEQGVSHLSARMWLDEKKALKDGGNERNQLIFWSVNHIKMAQNEEAYIHFQSLSSATTFCTQTTIRDERAYLESAGQYGFEKACPTKSIQCEANILTQFKNNMVLRRYQSNPKFQLLCLRYTGHLQTHAAP